MGLKRHRAAVKGGYRRTTVTIPDDLFRRVFAVVTAKPGLTMSAFVSEVLDQAVPSPASGS